jgi:excisionase family DNA binding protein
MAQNWLRGEHMPDYLRVQDLVEETGLNEETIRSYIRRKLLPAIRFGRDYLIDPKDWQEFKDKRRTIKPDEEKGGV